MKTEQLSDETSIVQTGVSTDTVYYTYEKDWDVEASSWSKFPSEEDPRTRYKHVSVTINASADKRQISRTTYSLLDWVGDIGGLFDGLNTIVTFFLKPLAVYAMNTKVTQLTVRFRN